MRELLFLLEIAAFLAFLVFFAAAMHTVAFALFRFFILSSPYGQIMQHYGINPDAAETVAWGSTSGLMTGNLLMTHCVAAAVAGGFLFLRVFFVSVPFFPRPSWCAKIPLEHVHMPKANRVLIDLPDGTTVTLRIASSGLASLSR